MDHLQTNPFLTIRNPDWSGLQILPVVFNLLHYFLVGDEILCDAVVKRGFLKTKFLKLIHEQPLCADNPQIGLSMSSVCASLDMKLASTWK